MLSTLLTTQFSFLKHACYLPEDTLTVYDGQKGRMKIFETVDLYKGHGKYMSVLIFRGRPKHSSLPLDIICLIYILFGFKYIIPIRYTDAVFFLF